jgi:hypothetical protein
MNKSRDGVSPSNAHMQIERSALSHQTYFSFFGTARNLSANQNYPNLKLGDAKTKVIRNHGDLINWQ